MRRLCVDSADRIVAVTVKAYDSAPEAYCRLTESFTGYPGLEEEIREFLRTVRRGVVIDVGSGSCRDALLVSSTGRDVVALDLSLPLMQCARTLLGGLRCGFVSADVRALPIGDRTVAGIICSGVLLHLPRCQLAVALSEIKRVLVRGGHALISMRAGMGGNWRTTHGLGPRWFEYYDVSEFCSHCRAARLQVVSILTSARTGWYSVLVTPVGSEADSLDGLDVGRAGSYER